MSALSSTKVKTLFAGFVFSLVLLVGIAVFGTVATLAALGSPAYANAPLLFAFFRAGFPYIVVFLLDGLLAAVLFVWMVWSAARSVSMPRSDRLAGFARIAERFSPKAREFGLEERVEPTKRDRMEELKSKYVADEIGEHEFERRMMRVMDDGEGGRERTKTRRGDGRRSREFEREF
ncbi:SHOCT domain-containing protein [Haladaptatus sp. CMAA 1911]|uniref:SHOCT domain-containing protein n=1 Tax=unclassified Haladaptatus TaxID=2622732 RepID=UPI0037549F96